MDFRELAAELLRLRAEQLKSGVWRKTAKLTQGELLALYCLQGHGDGAYPRELSRELSVSTARIAAMLRDMEEKGWIVRREDAEDNRHTLVLLTGEGRKEILRRREQTLSEQTLSELAGALEKLGREDAEELLRLLTRLNEICGK